LAIVDLSVSTNELVRIGTDFDNEPRSESHPASAGTILLGLGHGAKRWPFLRGKFTAVPDRDKASESSSHGERDGKGETTCGVILPLERNLTLGLTHWIHSLGTRCTTNRYQDDQQGHGGSALWTELRSATNERVLVLDSLDRADSVFAVLALT
jgi:hypothetical protein